MLTSPSTVAATPSGAEASLQIGPAAPLGDVGLSEEGGLSIARRRRQRRDLEPEPGRADRHDVRADPDLGNPEPEIARAGELGDADAGQGGGIDLDDRRRLLAHEHVEAAARELGEGSSQPEQGKGAPTGGRLLAAEEVDVELAGQVAARRTRGPVARTVTRDWRIVALAALEDGPPGRRRREHELRDVAVVDGIGVEEAVHQHQAVHLGLYPGVLG